MNMQLSGIGSLSDYLEAFGGTLASKAIKSLSPLHVPGRDPVPEFSYVPECRQPFDAQKHLVAATVKSLDTNGGVFICGEMGTGKSISAVLAIHEHARRSRKQGGSGGKYRAWVLCPDHLGSKWEDKEIAPTIPGATVLRFDKWPDFLLLMTMGRKWTKTIPGQAKSRPSEMAPVCIDVKYTWSEDRKTVEEEYIFEDRPVTNPDSGRVIHYRKKWATPAGATWIVIGRDQVKRQSGSRSLGLPCNCFDGKVRTNEPCVARIVDRKEVTDETGRKVWDEKKYEYKTKPIVDRVLICPKCGTTPTKKGAPLSPSALGGKKGSLQPTCEAVILQEVGGDDGKCAGRDILVGRESLDSTANTIPYELCKTKPGRLVNHAGKKWLARECGEPLYQFTRKPYWWPPALIIQRKLRKLCRYIVIDEAHEQKGQESSQSLAAGKVLAASSKCIALTGTMIGGYAWHTFNLLMRIAPDDLKARGFKWGDAEGKFTEKYGCMDKIVYSEAPVEQGNTNRQGLRSRRKVGDSKTSLQCRPGIMPTLFSQVVMPMAMFLKLEQFVEDLPGFDDSRFHALDLPPDIHVSYMLTQNILTAVNQQMIKSGNMKLMGTMLHTLLAYPDYPWGWEPMFPADPDNALEATHAVGWWETPKLYTRQNFRGVCSPENFHPEGLILPKERKLIDICKEYKAAGDQTWVYCEMTGKRNVMPRLVRLLESEGLTACILASGDCKPAERLDWIEKNGPLYDVMLSHPQLVATGVDLFSTAEGGHNFNHLVFYQTGYNLFRLIQASRRGWRISQWKDCTVDYLFYQGTAQAAAIALMGRKSKAVQKLQEGEIADEGLSIMDATGDGDAALVKALSEHVDPSEIQRNWGKVKSGGRNRRGKPAGAAAKGAGDAHREERGYSPSHGTPLPVPDSVYHEAGIPHPALPSPLDTLPVSGQIASELTLQSSESEAGEVEIEEAIAALKLYSGETEDVAEPEEKLSREGLARLFGSSGTDDNDEEEWDW